MKLHLKFTTCFTEKKILHLPEKKFNGKVPNLHWVRVETTVQASYSEKTVPCSSMYNISRNHADDKFTQISVVDCMLKLIILFEVIVYCSCYYVFKFTAWYSLQYSHHSITLVRLLFDAVFKLLLVPGRIGTFTH